MTGQSGDQDHAPSTPRLNGDAQLAGHIVQFYEQDSFLVDGVTRFIGAGLAAGSGGIVIATPSHRELVEQTLAANGLNVVEESLAGRYQAIDAGEALSQFMVDGWPDTARFEDAIGPAIVRAGAASTTQRVRAFGEMVALLWAQGNTAAAIRLEQIWREFAERYAFSLLCGYPMSGFGDAGLTSAFAEVAAIHSQVIPAESYASLTERDARLRVIAELQQKAAALETEVAIRGRLENELKSRLVEFADSDRRKDEFLAMLGHELRNPLAPVTTALQLMRLHSTDPARIARAREIIERQVARMTRLIDDLLEVSRITRGQITLREETANMSEVVERAVEMARPLIDERGHRLTLEFPDEPVTLVADSARLEQVLANLLNNAAKYTDVGGHISVRVSVAGDDVIIAVKDDGDGLLPEFRDRIFELFVQGPEIRPHARAGLGIGLTLVRRIVEQHGGNVEALSDGPGRGSEFVIRLPTRVAPVTDAASATPMARSRSVSRKRILVVDDNVDAAESLAELLRDGGHTVRTAHDGPTAVRDAEIFRPDVVVLDLGLPELDGFEVARRLRAQPRVASAVIVAVTGYGEERHRVRTDEAGFDHHFTKPVDINQLEALLCSPISTRATSRPN